MTVQIPVRSLRSVSRRAVAAVAVGVLPWTWFLLRDHLGTFGDLISLGAPFLAPEPMRGKTNEPAFVVHTAAAVASARGISAEDLADATTANFFRLFGKVPRPAGSGPA